MAEESELRQKRGRVKASLTRARTFIDKRTEGTSIEEVKSRFDKLDRLWEEFMETSGDERELDHNQDPALLTPSVDQLSSTLNRFVEQQRSLWDSYNQTSHATSSEVRLPNLNIPSFSCDYKEWPSFKDLFTAMVDKRSDLSAVQKLQYLKGLVKGEAASLIKHFAITEVNYHEAWDKLQDRYDKSKYILTSYIKAFYNQASISSPSHNGLRQLVDFSDEIIRGINALSEEAKSRDPWLIYTILSKADPDTRKEWSEESVDLNTPTLTQFFKFLNKRCDALHAYDMPQKRLVTKSTSIKTHHADTTVNCTNCSQSHQMYKCPHFKKLDILSRRSFVTKHSICYNCLSPGHPAIRCRSKSTCHYCGKAHHTLLHDANPTTTSGQYLTSHATSNRGKSKKTELSFNPNAKPCHSAVAESNEDTTADITSLATYHEHKSFCVLPAALVHVGDAMGSLQICRVLIDSGSQASFVSEDCASRLGHTRHPAKLLVHGLGSSRSGITNGVISLTLTSRLKKNDQITISAYVLPRLTSLQPPLKFSSTNLVHIENFRLADPHFNQPGKIDIILGADYFIYILEEGKHVPQDSGLSFQNTLFGYIVSGSSEQPTIPCETRSLHANICDIDKILKSFWEIEELHLQQSILSEEENFCETHFQQTHKFDIASSRYIVRLPLKTAEPLIGNTLNIAIARLHSMEKKFKLNSEFRDGYCAFMEEYATLNHLESIPPNELYSNTEHAYLPHHAVLRPNSVSTKLRVVFDGSVKSSSGISLNQKLCIGPKVHRDLFPILLSFRMHKIALVADIQKMYRQVLVHDDDRNYQRIVWRKDANQPLQHLRLTTVTYGTSAAPYLATRALKQVGEDVKLQYPLAAKAILENFYVDDLLAGSDDVETAIQLHSELKTALESKGFPLHKWSSNSSAFLAKIFEDSTTSTVNIQEQSTVTKILGLRWTSTDDMFLIDVNTSQDYVATKRKILSESSKIFDPLGLIAPVTITFKIMLQQLWLQNYDWDEEIRESLATQWKRMHCNLQHLSHLRIPRWLHTSGSNFELHGFSDASEKAYAAAIYCRATSYTGSITTVLVTDKTRVAPVKQISTPRLELNGALLLAKLFLMVNSALNQPSVQCIAWTDSKTVLLWLSAHPRTWKTYIGNRTAEILSILPPNTWHHVWSQDNPADIASRGMSSDNLLNASLWWNGPSFLSSHYESYFHDKEVNLEDNAPQLERKLPVALLLHTSVDNQTMSHLCERHSSLMKITRIVARCIQFVHRCKGITSANSDGTWITSREVKMAHLACIRWAQSCTFQEEIATLHKQKSLPSSSQLASLSPFVDKDNILRVGGRLDRSSCSFNTKHPIILPKDHTFVRHLIDQLHKKYLHAGTNTLLCIIRQNYWIISCRSLIKRYIKTCVKCVRYRAKLSKQLMGNLPWSRTSFSTPFEHVGVDYAGPLPLLLHRGRGAKSRKGYIAVFICFNTRALHLEAVSDLSREAFISCFKRFISRRGIPSHIYSDNGTNFVGTKRKFCELYQLISSTHYKSLIAEFSVANSITWHFSPPSAPHFGGNWESAVKLMKQHLRRAIGDSRLTFEELSTVLAQVEAVVNSRPITSTSDDVDSFDVLTTGHFLIGKPLVALPESPSELASSSTLLNRWKLTQKIRTDFWNRWYKEYHVTLQNRPKWRQQHSNLDVGDLVLIKEDNMPPATWALGRIVKAHPGQDNFIRVVTLRTSNGELKRPIVKLCKLPIVKDS